MGLLALLPLSGGIYLGWALGANDASYVFGTAVGARIIPFRTAAVICAVAIIVGAALQGENGIHNSADSLLKQHHRFSWSLYQRQ